jgi:hypothetical protein
MLLCNAAEEIVRTVQTVSAGKTSRFRARLDAPATAQGGNVSKNSGKRLPDSFSGTDFRMYSWATVITI